MIKTITVSISKSNAPCPKCGSVSKRHSINSRIVQHLGVDCPCRLKIVYSKHYCKSCNKYFSNNSGSYIPYGRSRYSSSVHSKAVELYNNMSLTAASDLLKEYYHVKVPPTTIYDWWKSSQTT